MVDNFEQRAGVRGRQQRFRLGCQASLINHSLFVQHPLSTRGQDSVCSLDQRTSSIGQPDGYIATSRVYADDMATCALSKLLRA